MTTVQIVGIAVAAAIVLLLIIALLVTRRKGSATEKPAAALSHASFLDDAPQDTLSSLGRAEQPMEDITIDPGAHRSTPPADEGIRLAPPVVAAARASKGEGLGLDWGRADDETTGELSAPAVSVRPSEGGSADPDETASDPGAGSRSVPLSDIIVTTSNKLVDLQDLEVRRMLADLVKDEIDQATHFRQQGQTIDAVLQLTEAEKISRALDMRESADAIRKMMEELQSQV